MRREAFGLSQSELTYCANVGLCAIQMYEQCNKDVDHAEKATLHRLSRVPGCRMEDLRERQNASFGITTIYVINFINAAIPKSEISPCPNR